MAKYAYEANPQLSPHFCAREFRCKCSSPHTFQVSEQLISMLERLYTALDCGKIIVSSGYRCAAHDKAVGGNGAGQRLLSVDGIQTGDGKTRGILQSFPIHSYSG